MSTYNILYVLLVFSFALSSIAMWINWRLNPHELAVRDWAVSLSLILVGSAFSVIARLQIPDAQSMSEVTPYTLLRDLGMIINGLAWFIIWASMRRFMNRPLVKKRRIATYTLIFALFILAAHPLKLSGAWGVVCISAVVSFCSGLVLYELLKPGRGGAAIWIAGLGFSIAVISWGVRALLSLINMERAIDQGFDNLVLLTAVISAYACMFGLVLLTNQRLIDQLKPHIMLDEQTGILSKESFVELTQKLLEDARSIGHSCCLVHISLDNFEEIEYEYGYESVSIALKQISRSSIQVLGRNDLFCRYAKKEFLFLLYGKSKKSAFSSMFRLRAFLEQNVVETEQGAFRVRLAMNLTQWNNQDDLMALIQKTVLNSYEAHLSTKKKSNKPQTAMIQFG